MQLPIRTFLFSAFFIGLCFQAYGQKFILLQKGNNQKTRLKYEIGESFTYQTKNNAYYITDVIKDIEKDIIILSENILRPEDITSVYIHDKDPRNHTLRNLSKLSYGGGALWLTTNLVNNLYQEKNWKVDESALIGTGVLLGTGFALSKVRYKHFKQQGRKKIKLIILYDDAS
ncbi:hypothetical protein ACFOUP_15270 [Belliella kenyensis]|uniref:Secreted protein n=1 Tax=Belliella kenyensis TaxID=1472724 RepID=A0ABV8ENI2_9BACT|nr:hypothetical protein [Belliella kenyensis]MCH7402083.1 hypothetical protein [Belliella kenyensis]MDN3601525.1 hypothetical protein [Belliella kenyensis]MDN3605247.1 hypothetical protein [Belliella kenyensis]